MILVQSRHCRRHVSVIVAAGLCFSTHGTHHTAATRNITTRTHTHTRKRVGSSEYLLRSLKILTVFHLPPTRLFTNQPRCELAKQMFPGTFSCDWHTTHSLNTIALHNPLSAPRIINQHPSSYLQQGCYNMPYLQNAHVLHRCNDTIVLHRCNTTSRIQNDGCTFNIP
jgi:hypothetical protein